MNIAKAATIMMTIATPAYSRVELELAGPVGDVVVVVLVVALPELEEVV